MNENMNWVAQHADWFYLIGAVLFILTLRGLSSPKPPSVVTVLG